MAFSKNNNQKHTKTDGLSTNKLSYKNGQVRLNRQLFGRFEEPSTR